MILANQDAIKKPHIFRARIYVLFNIALHNQIQKLVRGLFLEKRRQILPNNLFIFENPSLYLYSFLTASNIVSYLSSASPFWAGEQSAENSGTLPFLDAYLQIVTFSYSFPRSKRISLSLQPTRVSKNFSKFSKCFSTSVGVFSLKRLKIEQLINASFKQHNH